MFREIGSSVLADVISFIAIAALGFLLKKYIRNAITGRELRNINEAPKINFNIINDNNGDGDSVFSVENTGNIDIRNIRVFLIEDNMVSNPRILKIIPIKILKTRILLGKGGYRTEIYTKTLFDGCNVTSDQRYIVEFVDEKYGTIYRASQSVPSVKDGSVVKYDTVLSDKRLPKGGKRIEGDDEIRKVGYKYGINLIRDRNGNTI